MVGNMTSECIEWQVDSGIATLTITREKALNALNNEVMAALDARFDEIRNSPDIKGLIITGAGDKAFVAGADIGELQTIDSGRAGRAQVARGQAVLSKLEALPCPVIACINGFALGGGLELALACHIRYGVISALLGLPEVKLGLIPGYGGTQRLSRAVGRGVATEMILTGEFSNAEDAYRIGLLNKVFENKDEMLAAATKTLRTISKRGPLAVRAALEAMDRGLSQSLGDGLKTEADLFGLLCETKDMREGLSAFLEKRKADFQGQ
jgi:enoyl-CoA hydratase